MRNVKVKKRQDTRAKNISLNIFLIARYRPVGRDNETLCQQKQTSHNVQLQADQTKIKNEGKCCLVGAWLRSYVRYVKRAQL